LRPSELVKGESESGSAPVEFLAFGIPLILITLISVQLLVTGYLGNVAFDAANEGAQSLAYSDGSNQAARDRVTKVLEWLAPQSKFQLDSISDLHGAVSIAQVTVHISNPLALWGGQLISESASVIDETN
jgi:hypothetical protein